MAIILVIVFFFGLVEESDGCHRLPLFFFCFRRKRRQW
jgi:hypothetical protein